MSGPSEFLHAAPWVPELRACTKCTCRPEAQQVVPGIGPRRAQLLLVGQNPGEDEDQDGVPFIGKSGEELEKWLAMLGLARNDVAITNAVKCHTTANRAPRTTEVDTCVGEWFIRELAYLTEVKFIFTLGKPALKGLIGKDADLFPTLEFATTEIEIALGPGVFPRKVTLVPLPHPAYLLRSPGLRPTFLSRVLPAVRELVARVESAHV